MNVLVINGSLSNGGNTEIMSYEFKKAMEKKNNFVKVINLSTVNDEEHSLSDIMENIDMIVFATPIYWAGMSGLLKKFIDCLNPQMPLIKNIKYGLALVNSEYEGGTELTINHFQLIFKYLGVECLEALLITGMKGKGDMNDRLGDIHTYVDGLNIYLNPYNKANIDSEKE